MGGVRGASFKKIKSKTNKDSRGWKGPRYRVDGSISFDLANFKKSDLVVVRTLKNEKSSKTAMTCCQNIIYEVFFSFFEVLTTRHSCYATFFIFWSPKMIILRPKK